MLQFLVLGLVPGTGIQINFGQIVDVLTICAVALTTPHLLRYAEERKKTHN